MYSLQIKEPYYLNYTNFFLENKKIDYQVFPDILVILEKFYTCVYSSEEENEYESIKTSGNDKRNLWCPHLTVAF